MLQGLTISFMMFFLAISANAEQSCEILKGCIRETQSFAAEINRPAWVYQLESQGLKCKKNNSIFECSGKTKCSPEPVHFYGSEKLTTPKQMHVHFHGHNITGEGAASLALHYDCVTGNGDFSKFLKDSNAETLLIVPRSTGSVDTFTRLVSSPQSTENLFKCLRNTATTNTISKISLSSHSGSDRILEQIFAQQKDKTKLSDMDITGVGLFDSLYNTRPQLFDLKRNSKFPFWNAYVAGGTTKNNQNAMKNVPASANYRELPLSNTGHMEALKKGSFSEFLKAVSK